MKFSPGRSSGRPEAPTMPPMRFMARIASSACSEVEFRLLAFATVGSALSKPSASTLPLVQWRTRDLRTASASWG